MAIVDVSGTDRVECTDCGKRDHFSSGTGRAHYVTCPTTFPRPPWDDAEREAASFPHAMCGDRRDAFMCNRREGHEGDHVAGAGDRIVNRWTVTP